MGSVAHNTSSLEELARRLGGKLKKVQEMSGEFPSGISIDTRTLKPGNIYIAIRGKKLNGHDFLNQAKDFGAGAFVIDQEFFRSNEGERYFNLIIVPDTTKALQRFATSIRDDFKGPVVGITGSSGKTTTKEIAMNC